MKKTALTICAIALLAIGLACSDANRASIGALNSPHKITVYSGGQVVRVWHSTGIVEDNAHSDGCYFEDAATRRLVEVQGACVIEQE